MKELLHKSTSNLGGGSTGTNLALFRKFSRVASAFFFGNAKWKARSLFALMLVLCCTSTGLLVVISYLQRDFSTAINKKNEAEFYSIVAKFLGIVCLAAPFLAVYDFVQGLLAVEWRRWMTQQMLSKYFANRSYFHLKMEGSIDNPDQRIAEDIASFTGNTVSIVIILVGKLLNLAAFSRVLWSISPGLVYFLVVYSVFGTTVSLKLFGQKLMRLRFDSLEREADFRYSLVRVRENSESIAFYQGEGQEAANTWQLFQRIILNLRERLVWLRHLSLFTHLYEHPTIIVPSLIIAPLYFSGKVEFGVIMQANYAFRINLSALTVIIRQFDELSGLAAQTERLASLLSVLGCPTEDGEMRSLSGKERGRGKEGREGAEEGMPLMHLNVEGGGEGAPSPQQQSSGFMRWSTSPTLSPRMPSANNLEGGVKWEGEGEEEEKGYVVEMEEGKERNGSKGEVGHIHRLVGPGLVLRSLSITTPNLRQTLFAEGLSLSLSPGDSLLVLGPSGCGKSSLLRAISGLWTRGRGSIEAPPREDTFFLPQKPYMPLGTLRTQLLFPGAEKKAKVVRDKELKAVLEEVALGGLDERVGGFDVACDWSDILSSGEQQRVAFARVLMQRPVMAFLDEASSSLDSVNETRLYKLVQDRVTSYVSVGHRMSLTKFHSLVLLYDEREGWKMTKSTDFVGMGSTLGSFNSVQCSNL